MGNGRRLKVYSGCFDGLMDLVVAAPNKAEAAKAFQVSLYHVSTYATETGNDEDMGAAMSQPGTVFTRPATSGRGVPFVAGIVRHRRGDPWPPSASALVSPSPVIGE